MILRVGQRHLHVFTRASSYANSAAIVSMGKAYSYEKLDYDSQRLSQSLLSDKGGQRVAIRAVPSYEYVVAQWAIWKAGAVCVPTSVSHSQVEVDYLISDSESETFLEQADFAVSSSPLENNMDLTSFSPNENDPAMIIYTSGTTGSPKGVVYSHGNLDAQVESIREAWELSSADMILHALPLHHVHGAVNACIAMLSVGAQVDILPKFNAKDVMDSFIRGNHNVFMAVPTMYSFLIREFDNSPREMQEQFTLACRRFRLMISGSSALPDSVFNRWEEISGHRLLERYGMTEIGMALGNPLYGERRPGFVGKPFPGVECRLNEQTHELEVKGPGVFKEYYNRPDATTESFTDDRFFKTGDIAGVDASQDYFMIGRSSIDVLKSAGYKISALEIERVLLNNPKVRECAVVGIPDETFGQIVGVIIALETAGSCLPLKELEVYCKDYLAAYKIPRRLLVLDSIPRNSMGKLEKKKLVQLFD